MSINGFSFAEGQDYMKMDEASLKGFSWSSSMEALKKFAALNDEEAENFPYTTMLPEFGTLRVAGIDADLPYDKNESEGIENEDDADQAAIDESAVPSMPERIQFAMKSYEVALNKPYNGIPTDVRVAYEDMSIKVPGNDGDEFYQQLQKLGYDRLVVSSNLEANWDEANQNLIIKDISVSGQDMGSVSLSGLVGGFTKEFFSGDKVMTQVALLGLKAQQVSLKIEEKGIITKGIKLYAEENDMSEDDVRGMVSLVAAAFLQELASDQPQLQDVVGAFSAFLAKPNIFEMTVKSKAEKGIGALELMTASQNPLSARKGDYRGKERVNQSLLQLKKRRPLVGVLLFGICQAKAPQQIAGIYPAWRIEFSLQVEGLTCLFKFAHSALNQPHTFTGNAIG